MFRYDILRIFRRFSICFLCKSFAHKIPYKESMLLLNELYQTCFRKHWKSIYDEKTKQKLFFSPHFLCHLRWIEQRKKLKKAFCFVWYYWRNQIWHIYYWKRECAVYMRTCRFTSLFHVIITNDPYRLIVL